MVSASRNISHLVIFNLVRDGQLLRNLAREIYPGNCKLLLEAHRMATENQYGYLYLDLHPFCNPKHRLRTNVLSVSLPNI
jgi:hypothetical protein